MAETVLNYFLTFVFQITYCELLLCSRMRKRRFFWARVLVFAIFCAVPVIITERSGIVFYQLPVFCIGWFTYSFILMFFISTFLTWFCFRESCKKILYFCIVAYITQNMTHMIRGIVVRHLLDLSASGLGGLILETVIAAAVPVFVSFLFHRQMEEEHVDINNLLLTVTALLSILIITVISYWSYAFSLYNISSIIYEGFCCLLLLIVLSGFFNNSKMKLQNLLMERMYSDAIKQQRLSKENIDIINRKCHDLKYQALLMKQGKAAEAEKYSEELEEAVSVYDALADTGNESLDVILTEKLLQCEQYGIHLSWLIDGEKFSFMDGMDIYSLFGNALDNMIESLKTEKEENRIGAMHMAAHGNMLCLTIENYCSRKLKFRNGLPETTKEDVHYHGIGTKSIQYIVEKYNGSLLYRQEPETNRVILTCCFPLSA